MSKVKGFFSGKEDNKEIVFPEKNADSEVKNINEQHSEKVVRVKEEQSESETIQAENQNLENDQKEKLEKQKFEEEAKSEKNEPENLEPKEQPKIDSKAKNIFDKF
jgi:peptidoglycan hydrolase CwlO-like protein